MSRLFAKYKNQEYLYLTNHRTLKCDIIFAWEGDNDKILDDFRHFESNRNSKHDTDRYYKPVSRDELTDIYNYCFIVVYDAQLVKEPEEKEFELDSLYWSDIDKEGVTIASKSDSIQKGWEMVERCLFAKKVKYSELEGARLRLVYQKKDGVEYDSPLIVEKEIKPEEIYKYYRYYEEL